MSTNGYTTGLDAATPTPKPQHKLIQSYLNRYATYTTYSLDYSPRESQIGTIDCVIRLLPLITHKSCNIYLGQGGIIIYTTTYTSISGRVINTADTTLLYSDPELKTKLQQIIQQYQEIPKTATK